MKQYAMTIALLSCVLAGTGCMTVGGPTAEEAAAYENLADRATKEYTPGQVYRMGQSGICGTVEEDNILVTHVIPGSPADGKIAKGDRVRGMQHRGMGGWGGIRGLVGVRMYRIGRDWDWHFYVTVERESLRGGKGNTVTYDLLIPPDPGNVCHYGPTGFFAKRYSDHLVVEVVEEESPSDGKLQKGDVIVAVDGQPIGLDAYKQFTAAIDKAESAPGGGKLVLTVERPADSSLRRQTVDGNGEIHAPSLRAAPATAGMLASEATERDDVTLNLKQLGSYSESAPVDCAKTDALITQTADYIVEQKSYGQLNWGLLGLLATGEEKYIKVVRDHLHVAEWAQPPADVNEILKAGGYVSWHWGYRNLLMTEYYLLTGDKVVLPAITQLSRTLAAGQDQAGLWGHRMAHPELGRAYGYGIMNQPTLSIFISLILAQKCGVDDPTVRAAIDRTHRHYDNMVGRGALPYGNHGPKEIEFTNNGTSGSLAVALALLDNREGARFYAAMSAAATEEILTGHGGPRWNILWSGLGANVAGPEMAAAYDRKIHWLRTSTRRWNGRYCRIFGWGSDPKSDATGSHLLNLCAGRRAIGITGKGMDKTLWVEREQAEAIIEVGTLDCSSTEALLSQLGSPYPAVRLRSAQQLAMRDVDVSDEVMALLAEGSDEERVGAIHAIHALKISSTADALMAIARDDKSDLWVRQLAIRALGGMEEARTHAPELLEMLVRDKPCDQPYGELDLALGDALVKLYEPDPYATDLDKDLFYRGVTKLLDHKFVSGRSAGMALIKNLPMEDLPRMVDKIVYLIEDKDKTYASYTGAGRQEAMELLYRHGIKESMDYTINTIKEPTGRGGPGQRARVRLLNTFGGEATYLIPRIKEVLGKGADEIVKNIEASETVKPMITLDELKKRAK